MVSTRCPVEGLAERPGFARFPAFSLACRWRRLSALFKFALLNQQIKAVRNTPDYIGNRDPGKPSLDAFIDYRDRSLPDTR